MKLQWMSYFLAMKSTTSNSLYALDMLEIDVRQEIARLLSMLQQLL